MKKQILLALAILLFPLASTAREEAADNATPGMQETVSISINFNGVAESPKAVPELFDEKLAAVRSHAQSVGIDEVIVSNQSYNIYTQMNNGQISNYQYNASATFKLDSANKGVELMELLTKNGIQTSVNVNMNHRGGGC